jgi:hypothetical protein
MTKLVVAVVAIVVAAEICAFVLLDRELVVAATGAALVVVLLEVRRRLTRRTEPEDDGVTDGAGASLQRWLSRTETLISWSESSRSDWDRRLRPMLARQFELAAGQRKAKDPNGFDTTGRMLFGDRLWPWVDPDNVSRTGSTEPGPGRDTLDEILRRLERL